ncbi:hypothetical protein ACSQ67_003445 [Phaseolus vulgaris]
MFRCSFKHICGLTPFSPLYCAAISLIHKPFDAKEKVHAFNAGKWSNKKIPKLFKISVPFSLASFTLSILPMQYRRHLLSSVTSELLVDKGESSFSKFLSIGESFLLARALSSSAERDYCLVFLNMPLGAASDLGALQQLLVDHPMSKQRKVR